MGFSETTTTCSALPAGQRLDVALWYPARAPSPTPLTYRAYIIAGNPGDTAAARREAEELGTLFTSHGAPDTAVRAWLDSPMLATRDAPRAGPRFPLVLIAHGNMETVPYQSPRRRAGAAADLRP